jgi:hypothetical protein
MQRRAETVDKGTSQREIDRKGSPSDGRDGPKSRSGNEGVEEEGGGEIKLEKSEVEVRDGRLLESGTCKWRR